MTTVVEFAQAMTDLAAKRPLFHSEADFQHSLALELTTGHPKLRVRLERPLQLNGGQSYIDMILIEENIQIAVELKYKTKKLVCVHGGENFSLRTHAATNLARYDFVKDIGRVEALKSCKLISKGFVVFLTNDSSYWNNNSGTNAMGKAFYFSQGQTIVPGHHSWTPNPNIKSIGKEREAALLIAGRYPISWNSYSKISQQEFKYLLLEV